MDSVKEEPVSQNETGAASQSGLMDRERAANSHEAPKVSIGMPVYNGERYIRQALDSVLGQTFADFELIICDNASTDSTREICEEYAEKDTRIRYHRNEKNIGAGPNFNLAVEFARGEYFKWAAHDDICHETFFESCVNELDRNPDAVLAHPVACIIDEESKPVMRNPEDPRVGDDDPVVRFKDLTVGHRCFQVFGLMRLADLRATPMIGLFARGDALLLCWLALRGKFVRIDEELFFPRQHESQSMTMLGDKKKKRKLDYVAYSEWFDPRLRKRKVFPWWRGSWELLRCVSRSPIKFKQRMICYKHVAKWILQRRKALVKDVLVQFSR